ncbi:IS110 family transposase [[Clostridium] innocuum]|jgi:transposase|uniref:IS110 family transposase n=1 Tax=Faecalitalea cylindroides TaxID=39483 RepID=UPI0021480EF4|nr:IS110 family transposase [Faecalitalea cylindroides]MCR0269864.1 IS110 family transposase [[Clostridium] innocuum]
MFLVGIDIGKLSHVFCIMDSTTGEFLVEPVSFKNNKQGFDLLINKIKSFPEKNVLIGMEDTGHYHFNLLKFLLDAGHTVALINPVTTDMTRKMQLGATKDDNLDAQLICDILASNQRRKGYRISKVNSFELYEQKRLTREHHDLKEQLNVYSNKLQKCIDIVFPEFNSLFRSKYGIVYMNVLKTFGSADSIAHANIRSIRKCFETNGRGRQIALTPERLKEVAKNSIGFPSKAEVIEMKHLIAMMELIHEQIRELDKKIEEFSLQLNSPILSIPGISHFSGTSILAELGDLHNYSTASQIIKFAGVSPYKHKSSQYEAQHTAITKKGSRYLRKTLYQVILPVIKLNPVFHAYYRHKLSQGKGHRCAQGHCVRKLLRIIYHLVTTNQQFDSELLR